MRKHDESEFWPTMFVIVAAFMLLAFILGFRAGMKVERQNNVNVEVEEHHE